MKKKFIFLALIFISVISLQYSSGPASIVGQGYTGAPGESGTLCSNCHTGGGFGTPVAILSVTDAMGAEVTSYIGGETYQISLTAQATTGSPAAHGFQLCVLDENDADMADFSNPSSNAKISTASAVAGGRIYAEHNSASMSNTFTFDWVAPGGDAGELTFYYNVNLANDNGGTSGDNGGVGYTMTMNESLPKIKALGALEVNNAYTFPTEDGTANQVLTTDGAGNVSWMDNAAFTGGSTSNDNAKNSNSSSSENHKAEMEKLKYEVVLLKSEIEALKKLIIRLPEK